MNELRDNRDDRVFDLYCFVLLLIGAIALIWRSLVLDINIFDSNTDVHTRDTPRLFYTQKKRGSRC